MSIQRSRRRFLGSLGGGAVAFPSLSGCLSQGGGTRIFHAGSLAPVFEKLEKKYESEYGEEVEREVKGSVASTHKVTQLGRSAEVLAVADHRLLKNRVIPDFGDWYVVFASNSMSLHYTPDSEGADEINKTNWWEIISREGVKIGHSNPATDPGGYRAVIAEKLGAIEFRGDKIYDEEVYRKIRENSYVTTETEINLVSQLDAGEIDYAISYTSIAESLGVKYIEFPPEINLSETGEEFVEHYAKAGVETKSGYFEGAPIAYGMTVPKTAKKPGKGENFVRFGASKKDLIEEMGFEVIEPVEIEPDSESAPRKILELSKTG